ncbi:MAG TPA: hypothetical protein VKB79_28450 [Bryobacteraceae bacterium]|nr:hypothetical protein [Bryobacteraceae bacterium]
MKEYLLQQFSLVSRPERSVLDAICLLDQKRVFTTVFDVLKRDVIPRYNEKHQPITQPSAQEPTRVRRYSEQKQISLARERSFDEALASWARQFNLTEDLSDGGECLRWALDFGTACCVGEPSLPKSVRPQQRNPPFPLGMLECLPYPRKETFGTWYKRAKPCMRRAYDQIKASSESRESRQRNPDRYFWFVLNVCGGEPPSRIALQLSLPENQGWRRRDVTDDAIRKGIEVVISELGLKRKVRAKNNSKLG